MVHRARKHLIGDAAAVAICLAGIVGCGTITSEGRGGHTVVSRRVQVLPTYRARGEGFQVCRNPQRLTSPWTYDNLARGHRDYTVAQYEKLIAYGKQPEPGDVVVGSPASGYVEPVFHAGEIAAQNDTY